MRKLRKIKREELQICPHNPRIVRSQEHLGKLKESILKEGQREELRVHWNSKKQKWCIFEGGTRYLASGTQELECIIHPEFEDNCMAAGDWSISQMLTRQQHSIREKVSVLVKLAKKSGGLRKGLKEKGLEKYYKSYADYYQCRDLLQDPEALDYLQKMERSEVPKINIRILGKVAKMTKTDRMGFLARCKMGEPIHQILEDYQPSKEYDRLVTLTELADKTLEILAEEKDPEDFLSDIIEKLLVSEEGHIIIKDLKHMKITKKSELPISSTNGEVKQEEH